jgi:uncharacterized protein (UPF0212 family)
MDADAIVDARVERLSRRSVDEIRADLGVIRCPACRHDTLPLRNGRCAWCDRVLVKAAA